MSRYDFPSRDVLAKATIEALKMNGGEASTKVINKCVAELLNLSEETLAEEDTTGCGTRYMVRMRWCRTEMKNQNLIVNSGKGMWKLK